MTANELKKAMDARNETKSAYYAEWKQAERVTVETVDPWKMLDRWKRSAAGDPAQLAAELNVKELLSA